MDTLRLILIIVGLALIAGIYFRETRLQSRHREESESADDPFDMEGFSAADQPYPEPDDGVGFSARSDDPAVEEIWESSGADEAPEEVVVVLSLMASDTPFEGPDILATAKATGLSIGQMGIFHFCADTEEVDDQPWFGMANALEPGTFDLEQPSYLETPGLIFFLQLPGPVDGVTAFQRMLETARIFNSELGGQLCNERRKPLDVAQLAKLQERVRGFDAVSLAVEEDGK
ncbi:cell division protein ZipA [Thiohalomonas denitrificans]|uniref:Cell division protein ZipA n=1 Tax=Thiohalomonas denitrificans TaxID=415747 RepID=A0A1G5PIJ8_9GAMM|nr:cell division protein ZipA C-terminal FtsZ-binding domain-containing protein [Thiohalomonas denitrificans]SCZ49317.1 cell division protein ZipA [Thiohalomonas denitrificans]